MRTLCVLALVLLSCACTTFKPLSQDQSGGKIRAEIHVGDRVQVTLVNGSVHRFTVSAVGSTAVSGDVVNRWTHATDPVGSHIDAPYSDIQVIEVARSSAGKNTLLVVVSIVLALAIVIGVATGGGQHSPGFNR